ncbi:MAG: GAF domain-containing protein [Gemmatimonadota bacterium]|nr:MAG: GAF domain-containing protein [Gemmatimonadota bacterium]
MFEASEVVKEIQDLRDEGHLSDALLRSAVKTISSSDDRFDWVGVYLLNTDENQLWLHNYVGTATEHSKIPVGTGVCGTAVEQGANQNIEDVTKVDNYLACDPHVKSELVVLIRAGEKIFGQIDIDSRAEAAFEQADLDAVEAVADKLAEQLAAEDR